MVQCPECGNFDSMGLGFCVICGKVLPRPTNVPTGRSNASGRDLDKENEFDYEQTRNGVFTGLMLVFLTGFFILLYLLVNDTDPILILMVESFPILWFFLILMQWRSLKGKSGSL